MEKRGFFVSCVIFNADSVFRAHSASMDAFFKQSCHQPIEKHLEATDSSCFYMQFCLFPDSRGAIVYVYHIIIQITYAWNI